MSDSHLFDSTPVPPTGHDLLGLDSSPRAVRAAGSRGSRAWFSSRRAFRCALLALSIAGCAEDRHIKFCDPALPPDPEQGGCPAAGAGGGGAGGRGGGLGGASGVGGSGGIGGIGGSGGVSGSAGSGGAPGGAGGGVSDLDASAPSPDGGADASADAG